MACFTPQRKEGIRGGGLPAVRLNHFGYRRGEGGDKSNIRIKGLVYSGTVLLLTEQEQVTDTSEGTGMWKGLQSSILRSMVYTTFFHLWYRWLPVHDTCWVASSVPQKNKDQHHGSYLDVLSNSTKLFLMSYTVNKG